MDVISVVRGDSYSSKRPIKRTTVYASAGVPLNLSGCTVRTTLRAEMVAPVEDPTDSKAAWKGTLAVDTQGKVTTQHNIFMIGPANAGTFEIRMYSYDSRTLPDVKELIGDVQITEPSGEVYTLSNMFKLVLSDGVTHRVEEIKPTLILSPNGSFDKKGTVSPTIAGGVLTVPAEGNEWIETEATVNACTNPSFETGLDGWSVSGGGVTTLSRSSEWSESGAYSLKAVTDGTVAVQGFYSNSLVPVITGETWTISFTIAGSGNARIAIQERTVAGVLLTENVAASSVALTGAGQRLSYTRTITGAAAERISLRVTTVDAEVATIRIDAVQIEKKYSATRYCDGSLGEGHAWTGTPHASTSTRAYNLVEVGSGRNAWQVAEATTNLLTNPSFEGSTLGWLHPGPGALWELVSENPYKGNSCLRITCDGSAIRQGVASSTSYPITPESTVTISAYLRGSGTITLGFDEYEGGTFKAGAGQIFTLTSEWQRYTYTRVPVHSTSTAIRVYVRTTTAQAVTYFVDAIQAEQKAYATPYCDGSLGQGHAWTGTPHASSSTRARGDVRHTIQSNQVNNEMGTMLVRFFVADRPANGWERLAAIGSWNNSFLSIGRENSTLRCYTMGVGGASVVSLYGPAVPYGWNVAALSWGPFGRRLSLNGVVVASTPLVTTYSFEGKQVETGFNGQSPSGPTESIMLFDRPLSDIETLRIINLPETWTMKNTTSII